MPLECPPVAVAAEDVVRGAVRARDAARPPVDVLPAGAVVDVHRRIGAEHLAEPLDALDRLRTRGGLRRHVVQGDLEPVPLEPFGPRAIAPVAARQAVAARAVVAAERPDRLGGPEAEVGEQRVHRRHVRERRTVGVVDDRERKGLASGPVNGVHWSTSIEQPRGETWRRAALHDLGPGSGATRR